MEQPPYACGPSGRACAGYPLARRSAPRPAEAGGTAELRQIAQQIQKLASALHEAALLLEELDLPRVPAYTAQLSAAVSGFHIQTPDYSKLLKAFSDWLAYIKPVLPDAGTKTVSTSVIGRQMNSVRLGYYPTDPAHVAYIRRALVFPEGKTVNLLGPLLRGGQCPLPAGRRGKRRDLRRGAG